MQDTGIEEKLKQASQFGGKLILLGQIGSQAYGTSTPESDHDYMGIWVGPVSCYFGLAEWAKDGTFVRQTADFDLTIYEILKISRLMIGFNPNVVPLFYLRDEDYLYLSDTGRYFLENRDVFVSQKIFDTFNGFAKSQMHKVRDKITGKLGDKRRDIIAKYGYDVKFAAHTIRILRMCLEFAEIGKMNVYRGNIDADELRHILMGGWKEEYFFEQAEKLLAKTQEIRKDSKLPLVPDTKKVNKILEKIITESLTSSSQSVILNT